MSTWNNSLKNSIKNVHYSKYLITFFYQLYTVGSSLVSYEITFKPHFSLPYSFTNLVL
jgi:hypothetical protein